MTGRARGALRGEDGAGAVIVVPGHARDWKGLGGRAVVTRVARAIDGIQVGIITAEINRPVRTNRRPGQVLSVGLELPAERAVRIEGVHDFVRARRVNRSVGADGSGGQIARSIGRTCCG